MMIEKEPQCASCKHNITLASCGSCAAKGAKMVEEIAKELDIEPFHQNKIDSFKSTCKVILNYPEEYENIDPFNCRFYINNALRF